MPRNLSEMDLRLTEKEIIEAFDKTQTYYYDAVRDDTLRKFGWRQVDHYNALAAMRETSTFPNVQIAASVYRAVANELADCLRSQNIEPWQDERNSRVKS